MAASATAIVGSAAVMPAPDRLASRIESNAHVPARTCAGRAKPASVCIATRLIVSDGLARHTSRSAGRISSSSRRGPSRTSACSQGLMVSHGRSSCGPALCSPRWLTRPFVRWTAMRATRRASMRQHRQAYAIRNDRASTLAPPMTRCLAMLASTLRWSVSGVLSRVGRPWRAEVRVHRRGAAGLGAVHGCGESSSSALSVMAR